MLALIKELPPAERPREKLAARGAAALSDVELLALFIGTGSGKGRSALTIGQELLDRYGSLSALARVSVGELCTVHGIGPAKASKLVVTFQMAGRIAQQGFHRRTVDTPELVWELLGSEMATLARESLRVVLLDTKLHLLHVHEVSLGSLNESIAHPREVLKPVITLSAYAFILVHNHPSGDPTPSDSDRRATVRLNEAAKLLQVRMYDHVIIGTHGAGRAPYFSFREAGVI